MNPKIHTLKNGARVIGTSNHGFVFSDGTRSEAQDPGIVSAFTLSRKHTKISTILDMQINEVKMVLSNEQQAELQKLQELADIVIISFPILVSLKDQGIRHLFPKCVAFNATPETSRNLPEEKIVDINNWSW